MVMKQLLHDIFCSKKFRLKISREYTVVAVAAFIFTFYHAILTSLVISRAGYAEYSFLYILGVEWAAFVPLGLAMVFVIWLGKKVPKFFSTLSVEVVLKHAVLALVLFSIHAVWQPFVNHTFFGELYNLKMIEKDFMAFLEMRFLVYITMVGLVGGLIKIREQNTIATRASELRLELQKARLKEVELKMNPEIIYPNLRFIRKKAENNPEEASQVVILMAGILRKLVDNMEEERIELSEDIQIFSMYMDLVCMRMERHIEVSSKLKGMNGSDKVPSIILVIPLLEELFFGRYKSYTEGIQAVEFNARKLIQGDSVVQIYLRNLPNTEKLEEFLNSDHILKMVNNLLSGFENGVYFFEATIEGNDLLLQHTIEKEEVAISEYA